jgi:hypothetical protein
VQAFCSLEGASAAFCNASITNAIIDIAGGDGGIIFYIYLVEAPAVKRGVCRACSKGRRVGKRSETVFLGDTVG